MKKQMLIGFFLLAFLTFFLSYKTFGEEITILPLADSHVDSYNPNNNYGSLPELIVSYVKTKYSAPHITVAYFMFDLSFLPPESKVESASLSLYASAMKESTTIYIYFSSNTSWRENEITWSNAPSYVNKPIGTIAIPAPMKYYLINLTTAVNSALMENIRKFTLILASKGADEANYLVQFFSKESQIEEYKPKLKLVYSIEAKIGTETFTQTVWSTKLITTTQIIYATIQTHSTPSLIIYASFFITGLIVGILAIYLIYLRLLRKRS